MERAMSTVTTKDGVEIYYKDLGSGQPIVFSHGWPLSSDDWDAQMLYFGEHGFRCIAHDRRGHGRSTQTWDGNDMDTYADDLMALVEKLDLKNAIHVGHSTGGGEVARYIGRHGAGRAKGRVAKAVIIDGVPPLMLKTADNPGGLPIDVFDGLRAAQRADRAQFYLDVPTGPFYGFNRPGAKVSEGLIRNWWRQGMMGGVKATYDCIKAFSETDFTEDLKKIDVPTLIIHGDDDQIVPIGASAMISSKLVKKEALNDHRRTHFLTAQLPVGYWTGFAVDRIEAHACVRATRRRSSGCSDSRRRRNGEDRSAVPPRERHSPHRIGREHRGIAGTRR
jgi:non-heme chloroperoxidase